MHERPFWLIAPHTHSKESDGFLTPKQIVHRAIYVIKFELPDYPGQLFNLDAVAITDHDNVLSAQIDLGEYEKYLVKGEEVTTAQGHTLFYFKDRAPKNPAPMFLTLKDTWEAAVDMGALMVPAHPGNNGPAFASATFRSLRDLEQSGRHLGGLEVFNPGMSNASMREAQRFAREYNIPKLSGTDDHFGNLVNPYLAQYPKYSEDRIADFFSALERNETKPIQATVAQTWAVAWERKVVQLAIGMLDNLDNKKQNSPTLIKSWAGLVF